MSGPLLQIKLWQNCLSFVFQIVLNRLLAAVFVRMEKRRCLPFLTAFNGNIYSINDILLISDSLCLEYIIYS